MYSPDLWLASEEHGDVVAAPSDAIAISGLIDLALGGDEDACSDSGVQACHFNLLKIKFNC